MKKKLVKSFVFASMMFMVSACSSNPSETLPTTYTVTFDASGASGVVPPQQTVEEGESIYLPNHNLFMESYEFEGWEYDGKIYHINDEVKVYSDMTFAAKWGQMIAQFSQESYHYDKAVGKDMELPLTIKNCNLYYVEVDNERVVDYRYDSTRSVLVLSEAYCVTLEVGTHELRVITDGGKSVVAKCSLIVENSINTSFDEQTIKHYSHGVTNGIKFDVDFGGTKVDSIKYGDYTLTSADYSVGSDYIFINSSFITRFPKSVELSLKLSNNDIYKFEITNDVIFASDYDLVTTHSDTQSDVGLNPLYQYASNVSIVEAPNGSEMDGKVLKITPNTVDVTYDCNGYYTLRTPKYDATWYAPGFVEGKMYSVSFDYYTENTSVGVFALQGFGGTYNSNLLLGSENDGIVHHFSDVISYDEMGLGIKLYALFKDGNATLPGENGIVYVDNFRVIEIDGVPTFGTPENYASEGDLTVTFDSFGYTFDITIDGTKVENYTYDAVAKALTIPESALKGLELGTHTITAVTPVGNFSTKFIKVDKRIAEFVSNEVSYTSEEDETVSLSGTFSEGLSVLSVKQVDKQYTSSEDQSWDYAHADLEKNYVDLVTLTNGLDGKGSLTLSNEFLSLFWGDTQFDVEFSNGATLRFTLKSDVLAFSNYDDTTIYGYCGGVAQTNHGFQSGLNNGAIANIEEREEGNKALYIRSTENAAVATVFTQKYREHPWNWFYTPITNGNYTRVTFTYQLSNLPQNSAYFTVTLDPSENVAEKFFGDYDEVGNLLDFKIVKFYLKADGQVHTFDSGWFRNDLDYRMNRVDLPYFGPSSNAFAMFDDYKVVQTTSLPTDDREGSLTETSKNVSYNDKDVTLAGSFDETLKVASLIRYGADGVWDNGGNPVSIDTSYVTITKDGLKIADELINKLYGTTRFVLTFDNRKSVEFTLTTNVIYSSDYDKFNAFVDLPGNSVICQDRAMIDVVSVDGNRKIKFTPFNAVQGHSVSAINGSLTQDNGAFTFANPNKESAWWYNINVADDETFFIFFDYEVYAADKTPNYQVRWKDASGEWHAIPLTNSGSFYLELSGAEFAAIFINCPANQASEVEGTYMYIDNFGVGKK